MATSDYFEGVLPSSTSDLGEAIRKHTAFLVEDVQKMASEGASFANLMDVQERLAYLWILYGTLSGRRAGEDGPADSGYVDLHVRRAEDYREFFDRQIATDPDGISVLELGAWLTGKAKDLGFIAYNEEEAETIKARLKEGKE